MNTPGSQSQSLSFIPEKEDRSLEIPDILPFSNFSTVNAERRKSKQ